MMGDIQATCVLPAMESWDKNRISPACAFICKETEVEESIWLKYHQNLKTEFAAHV